MSKIAKHKTPKKTLIVRAVSLTMAGLMIVSVVLATVWQW